jgi:predicted ATPase
MIEKVRFVDFKSFEMKKPVTLPRFLVLVGDNGAGKTNFCDAFDFARDVLEQGLRDALLDERRGSFRDIVRGREEAREMRFHFIFSGKEWRLTYEFGVGLSTRTREPQVLSESLAGRLDKRHKPDITFLTRDAASSRVRNEMAGQEEDWSAESDSLQLARLTDEERFPALRRVRNALQSVLVLRPDVGALRRSVTVGSQPRLGSRGEGLPAILDVADPTQVHRLADWLAEGDRATKSIRLLPAEPGKKVIGIMERGESEPYRPEQISDGTLRLLAMLTAISGATPSISTLVLEEPENSIHFSRLSRLVELCRKQVSNDSDAQIILTTHSIPLLHALRREEVMAIVRGEDGISQILPPPDKEKWQRFRDEAGYTMGDLYTTGLWPEQAPRRYNP